MKYRMSVLAVAVGMTGTPSMGADTAVNSVYDCGYESVLVPAAGGSIQQNKATVVHLRTADLEVLGFDNDLHNPVWEGPIRVTDRSTKHRCTIAEGLVTEIYTSPKQTIILLDTFSGSNRWMRAYTLEDCKAITARILTTDGKLSADLCARLINTEQISLKKSSRTLSSNTARLTLDAEAD